MTHYMQCSTCTNSQCNSRSSEGIMQLLQTDAVLDEQVTQVSIIAGRLVGDIDLKKCSNVNTGTPW